MASSDSFERAVDEDGARDGGAGCPECGGSVWTNTVETICEDCGLVLEAQPIDHGPEWRSFEDDEIDPQRTGAPLTPTRHDRGLSTEIGWKRDANGTPLSGRKRRQLSRLRREQARGRFGSTAERNLAHGLTEIRRLASALGLGEGVRDQACALFRNAQNADLLPGRSIESMAAASVYGACRCNGLPRMLEEIVAVAQCDRAMLTTSYNVLNTDLGLPAQPMAPAAYVPQFASELDVSEQARQRALALAAQAEATALATGVEPTGVAAACLYLAAQEHGRSLTQSDLAAQAHTSPQTIRKHCEVLADGDS